MKKRFVVLDDGQLAWYDKVSPSGSGQDMKGQVSA
jgi:hypothetical protein